MEDAKISNEQAHKQARDYDALVDELALARERIAQLERELRRARTSFNGVLDSRD